MLAIAAAAGLSSQPARAVQAAVETPERAALSQCVALRTTGADRLLTARWLFAVMAKSPQLGDLSAVTPERTKEINQEFAKLVTRLVTKDCVDQVRPVAAGKVEDAFEQVGSALGQTAMTELISGKEVDKGISAYTDFLNRDDFKPLMDALDNKAK
jgi:hypothetical protein